MANKLFQRATAAASLASVVALSGCGGGGSSSSGTAPTPPVGSGQVQSFGALTANVVGALQTPVVGGSGATVVTGVAGATITTLQAAQSPALSSTQIAFDRQGQIYTMSPSGANVAELTSDVPTFTTPTAPSWGVGNAKLVFQRYDTTLENTQIFSINSDGTGFLRLTNSPLSSMNPHVSPNGATVLFDTYSSAVGHEQIYSVGIGGGTPTKLSTAATDEFDPAWSPDGTKFAYVHYDLTSGHYQIYIANANGSGAHIAFPDLAAYDHYSPVWSPDGTKIAYSWNSNGNSVIYVSPLVGHSQYQVTNSTYNDTTPTWSPDGTKIAFARVDASTRSQIYVANADGTQPVRITNGVTADATPAWSSLVTKRYFVGPNYPLGSSASGFLYGQQGDTISSLLTFDATTPSGTRVASLTGISPTLPNIVFTISASDVLTSLIYWNGLASKYVRVVGSGGTLATATDVVVSFNATTGTIASVLPYSSSHVVSAQPGASALQSHVSGGAIVLQGKFLAAVNSAGVNKAPQGATEIHLDSHTGELLSVQ